MMHWSRMLAVASLATGTLTQYPIHATNATTNSTSRWPPGLSLGVDYYPSQWPAAQWEPDMAAMAALNITYVRLNEFDWALLEPTEGAYNFTLLDASLALLARHGLRAVLGTPTASPPAWLAQHYDIAFVDAANATYAFGSRRYYSFSAPAYRAASQRITRALAARYGAHPVVAGWQLDNELGCHGTVRSYDAHAAARFRGWLAEKYGTVAAMNAAQGRVFWSNQYGSFAEVLPPFREVYVTNPLHTLDWYTFSSDMVAEFAAEQAAILRELAPAQAVTTNFQMGFVDFDHHAFARKVGLDITFFDEYPLSGPKAFPTLLFSDAQLAATLRTGLPDYQALQHALYRGIAAGGDERTAGAFGVMEMEPGVLNWNQYRVSPLEGMARLWTLETFAAGGDVVSYFRWRQVPYAQEQTLSGLHLADGSRDAGFAEVQEVSLVDLPILRAELGAGEAAQEPQGDVALVFDYAAVWVWAIEPYSGAWDSASATFADAVLTYYDLVYTFYAALRRLGLSVDVLGPAQPLAGYKVVVVPSSPVIPAALDTALAAYDATGPVIFGPRSAALTPEFAYAPGLQPSAGALRDRLPLRVTRIETPPAYAESGVAYAGSNYSVINWEEGLECARGNVSSSVTVTSTSRHKFGKPAACASSTEALAWHYIGFNPPVEFLVAYLGDIAAAAGISDLTGRAANKKNDLGNALRLLRRDGLLWAFNYGTDTVAPPAVAESAELVIGKAGDIPAAGVAVWKISS